jgi:sRNA-binding regulator protein Hfq
MSLSDHLRILRALDGGTTPDEIAARLEMERLTGIAFAEQIYRPVTNELVIEKLAEYYGRSLEEFHWHNERPRKFLTFSLAEALRTQVPISFTLRSGEILTGQVEWWDLSSVGLRQGNGRLLVVQRHVITDWPEATKWKDYQASDEEE